VIIETIQRPGLLDRLRAEVAPVAITDTDGKITVDIPKLLTQCPLLTSIFQECLRTKVSGTIVRQLTEDLESDGYILKKDSYLMSPSWIPSHGSLWDVPGHPADSFWPERFIEMPKLKPSDTNEKSQFDMAMKPENFFRWFSQGIHIYSSVQEAPMLTSLIAFGGGNVICTGRFFAKQEILVAAALLILKFEIEPQGWVTHTGKRADRAAKPDASFAGSGVLPPDRDMMVKIRRIK
jgi:cytochrome P450